MTLPPDGPASGRLAWRASGILGPEARTSARTHEGDPLAVLDDLAALRRLVGDRPDAAAALDRVEAALLAARRARSALLSDLSHELRTPLGAILGFLHLLRQDDRLLGEQRAHVEVIHRSSEQLLALVDELTAADAPGPVPTCDLHQLLDELADMLCLRAAGSGVALRFERQAGLPRLVRIDPLRLRQLLLLLIGNVVAGPRGDAVIVQVQVDRGADDEGGIFRCRISVPGLREDDLELRDFVRTDAGLQPQGPLDLVALHVQPLGGGLHVATGQICLDLPVGLGHAADPRPARLPTLAPDQPEVRLLVAEDRWQGRHLLVHALERAGFAVREAADGREALRLWETWRPHLVWMDMRMPVVSGIEATRQIKQSPRGADTIVVALTASAFEADEATARAAGCDDFLRKPLRLDQVFAALARHLGVRYRDDEPGPTAPAAPDPDVLAGLPRPWLVALQQAAVQADLGALQRMIDPLRPQAPRAAAALMDMLERYDYPAIQALVGRALRGAQGAA